MCVTNPLLSFIFANSEDGLHTGNYTEKEGDEGKKGEKRIGERKKLQVSDPKSVSTAYIRQGSRAEVCYGFQACLV